MNFTQEQLAAIELRDGPLFLHAGAGSGKTRVLVERFVRSVCEDGIAVDRLLAITFTEKAAAELKGRVRKRFIELGERDRAREAERAWVSTIHGFCSRLLRTNALAAGIDPEFRVLDEGRAARLAIDSFDGALEDFVRAGGERLDLAASYTPDKLERMVRTVYSRLRSQGQTQPRLPDIAPPVESGERARLERALAVAGGSLAAAGENRTVLAALAAIDKCGEAIRAVPVGQLGDPLVFDELRVKRGNAVALRGPEFDELAEAMEAWVSLCKASRAYDDYVLLAKLVDRYARRYAAAKEDRSALDFEDLELRARDLLKRDRVLRAEVRGRFDAVMVDEFQDTNQLQNELLDLVSDGNLFSVGDELQSIYGFRNADVGVFRRRREEMSREDRTRRLATSFRAHPEVLEVVNAAFATVWEDYPPLAPGRAADAVSEEPRVDLLVVDSYRRRWDDALPEDAFGEWMAASKVTPWRAAEARLLARRIDELAGPGRRYRHGDVAVLLRATRDMDVYERALNDRGIPTYASGGGGYWSQQQIADLRAYLAALANPRDERSLYTLLASPLVGASLDALALIRFRAGVKGSWRDAWNVLDAAFLRGDRDDGLGDALADADRERIERFVHEFAAERAAAPRMSLERLIDRAVTESGYDRAILELPEGARRMANVRKLMRLAREYEAESGRDLRGFIDFVDEQELLVAREGEAPTEGEGLDAVRLMTIHAAKGLEFPVVCVADLGRSARAEQGALQVSADGRVGLQLESLGGGKVSGPEWERIKEERDRADEAEEKRIFYVAMTRAQEHLVVSGATDTEKWQEAQPLGAPMDWAWRALEAAGVQKVVLTVADADELLPPEDRVPHPPEPEAVEVQAAQRPRFAPVADGVPLPVARLSYSALESYKRCGYRFYVERVVRMRRAEVPEAAPAAADAGDGQLALDAPPAAERRTAGIEPRVRGTVVHELLEAVDWRRPAPPSRAAVERKLTEHGAPSAPADELIELVEGALSSPVAERLRAARRVRAELAFAFELAPPGAAGEPLIVDGFLDAYAEEEGGALIVDYKTDALAGRDPAAATEEKYGAQRLVYALAALRAGAPRVEVVHLFLERPESPATATYEASDVAQLEAGLIALAEGIVNRRFSPTDKPHRELCQGCPAQAALCIWGPDRTMADRPEGEGSTDPEPVDVRAGVA